MLNPTRERLINTAERLYALHGLDGVSLDRIRREAGEKNASALQYHFGSKADLGYAVVEEMIRPYVEANWRPALADPANPCKNPDIAFYWTIAFSPTPPGQTPLFVPICIL